MRIKICKKEAKESRYWLRLSSPASDNKNDNSEKESLINEATELMKIFGAILRNSE
jgi:four helix bundle protein